MFTERPLILTVEHQEEWSGRQETLEASFVLRANGHEVHRGWASVSSDTNDAEEWAAKLLSTVIEAALQAERDSAPRWEELRGD